MTLPRLILRNLRFFWRTNLAVVAGIAAAVSVLSGALVVGDSVRGSLRAMALGRLGRVDFAVSSERLFPEDLAERFRSHPSFAAAFRESSPVLLLQGVVAAERSGARARGVEVYGVDDRFWSLHGSGAAPPQGREAFLGAALAEELGAREQDTLLLRVDKQQGIPRESLFGRRDDAGRTTRLTCKRVLGAADLGEFSLRGGQAGVRSIFVPLARLQRDLERPAAANAVLLASSGAPGAADALRRMVRETTTVEDLGVRLRRVEAQDALSFESDRVVVDDALARAGAGAAAAAGLDVTRIYTYLANSIRVGDRSVPYSVVTAAEATSLFPFLADAPGDAIWLNDWAARDLGASAGDAAAVDYFYWAEEGRLVERTAQLRIAGTVPVSGVTGDPTLAPEFPGITEAEKIGDWDPPFPIDLRRIRPEDEQYWRDHRTAPKAFLTLARAEALWGTRFGRLTSLRLTPPAGRQAAELLPLFRKNLAERLDPERSGMRVAAVKDAALTAARGTTDFGEYFLYFSFFLIGASGLLAALFFRLGVEQRIREIGILRASGFTNSVIRRVFLGESAALALLGALLGAAGALSFAALLLAGLRTWWIGAVGTRQLFLHASPVSLAAGAAAGVAIALAAAWWTIRGLRRNSTRALLAGSLEPAGEKARRTRALALVCGAAALAAAGLLGASLAGKVPHAGGFFGAGAALLAGLVAGAGLVLRRVDRRTIARSGGSVALRLGARNAAYRPGRSLLCTALIASATFVIVSVEAFRRDPERETLDRRSGTGGYMLFGQTVVPLVGDLNTAPEALNLSAAQIAALREVRFAPFRVRAGDDVSCLNLFAPQDPRILGARRDFLNEGRFAFSGALEKIDNPWLLLERHDPTGAIPAVADANTIEYVLHRKLGDEIAVPRPGAEPARLRLVAALRDSIFQGELIVSEGNFLELFPQREGYGFLLVDAPEARASEVTRVLEEGLDDYGMDVETTRRRLAAYHRVENTYLSTFQSLGALGLVLGTLGLGTVLLRNVLERRGELALLRAVGYSRADLARIVLGENLLLLALGLGAGVACAALAIVPALRARGFPPSIGPLAAMLGAVAAVGLAASLAAVAAAVRAPLLEALRNE